MATLTGQDRPVEIAPGYTLQAPDLSGEVEEVNLVAHARGPNRGAQEASLVAAFANTDVRAEVMFELEVTQDLAPTQPGARRADNLQATTRQGEPAIVFTAEQTRPNQDYAVLYTDEGGISRWILPEGSDATRQRRGRELVFHLPRAGAPQTPGTQSATRGPLSKLGRRVVRMVTWATDEIVRFGALKFAEQWEGAKRPYGFHQVQANAIGGNVDWDNLRAGRALLLLHGTFSTADAFSGLVASETFSALAQHYANRIFAFNHPSLYQAPTDNVQTLFDLLPAGVALDVDIVTHSRGGLVGRTLVERLADLNTNGRQLKVGKAVFVAAPQRGTILVDGENWLDLVDRYTNFLTNLPDNVYTLTMEGVLTLIKLVAHGALKGLPGLHSMLPNGPFLQHLNTKTQSGTEYYALTANFMPTDANLLARLGKMVADKFVDNIFGEANDGVVPTEGCYMTGTDAYGFPIPTERYKIMEIAAQVNHCNYFNNALVNRQIAAWLTQ